MNWTPGSFAAEAAARGANKRRDDNAKVAARFLASLPQSETRKGPAMADNELTAEELTEARNRYAGHLAKIAAEYVEDMGCGVVDRELGIEDTSRPLIDEFEKARHEVRSLLTEFQDAAAAAATAELAADTSGRGPKLFGRIYKTRAANRANEQAFLDDVEGMAADLTEAHEAGLMLGAGEIFEAAAAAGLALVPIEVTS